MGSIHFKKDDKLHTMNEDKTGAQVKNLLNIPSDSILVNERNQQISDHEAIGDKVRDGESIASYPNFDYW